MDEEKDEREGRNADREPTAQNGWTRWQRKPLTSKFRRARSPARGAGKPTEGAWQAADAKFRDGCREHRFIPLNLMGDSRATVEELEDFLQDVLPGTEGSKEVLTPEPTPDGRLKRKITSFGAGEGKKKWIATMLIEEKNLEEAKKKLGELMGEDYLIHVSPEEAGIYTLEANTLTGSEGEGHQEDPGAK